MTVNEWLAQTPQGKAFLADLEKLSATNWAEARLVWEAVWKGYAEACSGVVHVITVPTNHERWQQSRFLHVELPAFLANPSVTAIRHIPYQLIKDGHAD